MDAINALIDTVNGWLYGYVLVALLVAGGIYFTVRLQFLPTTLLKEALRTLAARGKRSSGAMSSFQALMVSTASRVGIGNIIGVKAAILAGGPGAVFWMWTIAGSQYHKGRAIEAINHEDKEFSYEERDWRLEHGA